MKTIDQAGDRQSKPRANRHLNRAFCFSWLATILLATGGMATADTIQIQVGGGTLFFDPDDVTIHQGDTVEWIWGESLGGHSVTSGANGVSNGLFDSGVHLDPFTFSYTFPTTGTFHYYCEPHFDMGMVGVIRVVEATTTPAALGNIATRLRVETGNNVLIGGFIVTGTQPKRIIVRAIGPSLTPLGIPGALADPFLELRDSSQALIASNDNWRSTQEAEIIATTVPPSDNLESAIVATLPANNSAYTAIVQGINGTGIGVVEAYDLDRTVDSKLANISTRGLVQTDPDVLIGGLIVVGQGSLRVIVRAIGPSLTPLGISGALGDPTLGLYDGNGTLIVANDNWRSDQEAEIIATTVPPTSDLESAIVRDMAPGNYTAIVRGVSNTTGIAVVEAFGLNN